MASIKPRRSAFSVYAEAEPEGEVQSKVIDTTRVIQQKKHKQTKQQSKSNQNHIDKNKGISKKTSTVKSTENKKLTNKFNKLPNNTVKDCISLFKANKSSANQKTSEAPRKVLHSTPFPGSVQRESKQHSKKLKQIIEQHSYDQELEADELIEDCTEVFDSRQEAVKLFKKIIYPTKVKEFFSSYWERKPMLVRRADPSYNKAWFSCKEFDTILRQHNLEFTTNIDVTTYVNEVKQNHNQEGRAFAPLVWDFFQQGCSIRLLNPQTYSRNCWKYLSTLQELFGTCVGANIYLTPAGTQGFAPHYDDIEAFVLQLEGKKRWRVYKPLSKEEMLPKNSSMNFEQKEIGEPIIDCTLEPGDLLYFPRGYIHQANACDDVHSLHITVSCYQKNSWGDFLAKLVPGAIEIAQEEDIEFRKGLPINYLLHNGVAFDSDNPTEDRKKFFDKTAKLMKKLIDYMPLDAAVDQMGKQFIHDSLPPCLNQSEMSRSIHGNGEKWNSKKMRVENIAEIEPDTAIKLIRRNCVRLCVEGDACLIYHNLENARVYHEKEPQYLEVEAAAAPAIEYLLKIYPEYCTVEELPLKTIDEKIVVASCLYDKGLLVTGEPLDCNDSDSESSDAECEYFEEEDDDDDDEDVNEENAELVHSYDNGAEFSDDENDDDDDDLYSAVSMKPTKENVGYSGGSDETENDEESEDASADDDDDDVE